MPLSAEKPPARQTDPRSEEILERTKAVFAEKGFDGASMQDLARGAGMSAGNFYRYFSSKDAIIAAIVERELAMIEAQFFRIMESPDPRAALLETIGFRMNSLCVSDGLLWTEIEAGASRRAEIGALHARMETVIARSLTAVFARIAGIGLAEAAERFGAHASLVMLLVHGTAMRSCGSADHPGREEALIRLVMKTVEDLLTEIAGAGGRETLVRNNH